MRSHRSLWLSLALGCALCADPLSAARPPLTASLAWTALSGQGGASFAFSVAPAGDVNGDGYGDVLVGAPFYDDGEPDAGRAFVYLGSAAGLSPAPAWSAGGGQTGARFGLSVAAAGDVNGDGFDDVLVAAPLFDVTRSGEFPCCDEGRVFLYLGSAAGPSLAPDWTADGPQNGREFGRSVVGAGDVDGDGRDDVIVGGQLSSGQTGEGWAALFPGTASGAAALPSWTVQGNQGGADLGVSVAGAGDLNGDGFADVVVGAPGYSTDQDRDGAAFAYFGSASGLAASPSWSADGAFTTATFGASVAGAGDVDGDGFDDLLVGDPAGRGRALLFLGSASGPSSQAAWTAAWPGPDDAVDPGFGSLVSAAGDVDGDGLADLLFGSRAGLAFLYAGRSPAPATSPDLTLAGESPTFGRAVAGAGDVDGDASTEVIVGDSAFADGPLLFAGKAYLYAFEVAPPSCDDGDGDGYGDPGDPSCPAGADPDCDDGDPSVHPGAAEICDGRDQDCDGTADEGFPVGQDCESGSGICRRTGLLLCAADGSGTLCSALPGDPEPEVCDGIDNDCDGVVDNGNPGGGAACATGLPGACASGTTACVGGSLTCRPDTPPSEEVCDGLDNDCDGTVDAGVQAVCTAMPPTLNLRSEGTPFTFDARLVSACTGAVVDPAPLARVHISSISAPSFGTIVLPTPSTAPGCDDRTEDGIWEDLDARRLAESGLQIIFDQPSDGLCSTPDGNRQDIIALLLDCIDDETVTICWSAAYPGDLSVECCAPVRVTVRGSR
jgi:hypothetical protein